MKKLELFFFKKIGRPLEEYAKGYYRGHDDWDDIDFYFDEEGMKPDGEIDLWFLFGCIPYSHLEIVQEGDLYYLARREDPNDTYDNYPDEDRYLVHKD